MAIFDYKLPSILTGNPELIRSFNRLASDARAWAAVAMVSLLIIALSPYVEQWRIPFYWWFVEHGDFRPIQSDQLGTPLGPANSTGAASIDFFEHGTVVWLKNATVFYRLRKDGTWEARPHINEVSGSKWWDPNFLSQMLNMPPEKTPHGGIAAEWAANPQDWNWLGGREWSCTILTGIYLQKFQHGSAFGILPIKNNTPDGVLFALLENGKWKSARAKNSHLPCVD